MQGFLNRDVPFDSSGQVLSPRNDRSWRTVFLARLKPCPDTSRANPAQRAREDGARAGVVAGAGPGGIGIILHQVPGFAVFFEAHLLGVAMGVEAQHGSGHADANGENVPDIKRHDVGCEEIDIGGGVDGTAFADGVRGPSFVGAGAKTIGGFDLNAKKSAAVVEDEVVTLGVSPGLGDAKAEFGGFIEEGGFGALSGALGVLEVRWILVTR